MKLIMENWREYQEEESHYERVLTLSENLQYRLDSSFVANSLNIPVPHDETYPYSSAELNEQVLLEYAEFEDWWSDLWEYDRMLEEGLWDDAKAYVSDKWQGMKELAGFPAEALKMMYAAFKSGKGSTYMKSLKRKGVNVLTEKIFKFLDFVIKYEDKVPKFAEWAKGIKEFIEDAVRKHLSEEMDLESGGGGGWKQIAGATVVLIGLKFIWNKMAKIAEDVFAETDLGGAIKKLTEWAAKKSAAIAAKIAGDLMAASAAVVDGGITLLGKKVIEWAKVAGEVVAAGFEILQPVLAFFKGRGGLDEGLFPYPQPELYSKWSLITSETHT